MKRLKERGFEKWGFYFIHHYHWEGFNGLIGQRIIKHCWMENSLMSCSHVGLPSPDSFIRSPGWILQVSAAIFVLVYLFIFKGYTQTHLTIMATRKKRKGRTLHGFSILTFIPEVPWDNAPGLHLFSNDIIHPRVFSAWL